MLPVDQTERIRRWSEGVATARVVRPRKESGIRRGFWRFLILAAIVLVLVGAAMTGIGKLAGSKIVSDFAVLPLWLGSGPLLAFAALAPFLFGLRWLQGAVERATPFWYYLDDELFCIYDTRGQLTVVGLKDLRNVHWSITKPSGLHPELRLGLATKDGRTFQHERTLFVAEKECAALCETLQSTVASQGSPSSRSSTTVSDATQHSTTKARRATNHNRQHDDGSTGADRSH